tara:strand:+ start:62219 stop:64807 length:2589 start_codon:yes stop_codon:yes gene_type:complete
MIEEEEIFSDSENNSETLVKITGMYKDWFLDYASYVILERAVPSIYDGFKPVQRRILHSMKDLDDGRYNKVANIVGHTMQYHPHGDASISDALVQIGQKDLLIDTQGNWGNILTGDKAAASRYIEARLSKFALEVVYSPKVTDWQLSYDGRKKEPVNLPVKFPMLLAQGAEGIAVGLSTKILPHNFIELINASIKYLKGKSFKIYPDFLTGGSIDIQNYNDGLRGGKIRLRASISQLDKTTLVVNQIPYSTNTSSLIDSILKANEKGKIKIKKIEDNTAENVEILIYLPAGISPDKTIDALYAFTDCESTISPLSCVIIDNKPSFIGVSEILKKSTDNTVKILRRELEFQLNDLENQWHSLSLERIFIENRIYRKIEDIETWDGVLKEISIGLKPYIGILKRDVSNEDIVKLTEIKIKRISKFDIKKAEEGIKTLEENIDEVQNNLVHLIDYSIRYFNHLINTYGDGKKRKTVITTFDDVDAKKVVVRNQKLYVNRQEGFLGTSLKKDEYVCDCSDIDDIIAFTESGIMQIVKVDSKVFIEKDIIYASVFKKKDSRTVYNMVYKDGNLGISYIKRFSVSGITRDKKYDLTQGNPNSKIIYFSANLNGEAEIITVVLRNLKGIKKTKWDIDFADIQIKGRNSKGNIVSKKNILRIDFKEKGLSTLKPRKVWFDEIINRLNVDEKGKLLGEFKPDDMILIVEDLGSLKTTVPDLSLRFDQNILLIEKLELKKPLTAIYFEKSKKKYYIKRFFIENLNKTDFFTPKDSDLVFFTSIPRPIIEIEFNKINGKQINNLTVEVNQFISVKGFKAMGNILSDKKIRKIKVIKSLPFEYDEDIEKNNNININNPQIIKKNSQSQTSFDFS